MLEITEFLGDGIGPESRESSNFKEDVALLAFGMLLDHIDRYDLGHTLRLVLLDSIAGGKRAADLGGSLSSRAFSEAVIADLEEKLSNSSP